jgi:hypothetical protein
VATLRQDTYRAFLEKALANRKTQFPAIESRKTVLEIKIRNISLYMNRI